MEFSDVLTYYLTAINAIALLLFLYDKWMARSGAWRVSERILLLVALFGGSAGALAGMKLFRHKTRKTSFQLWMGLVLLVQTLVIGALLYTTGGSDILAL